MDLDPARGRAITHPRQLPVRGWKDVLWRLRRKIADDNLSVVSAGVAFFVLLAFFPGLTAMVSLYALVVDPGEVHAQVAALGAVFPGDARELVLGQPAEIASAGDARAGLGLLLGLGVALWGAARGSRALFSALNIVYGEPEGRGFFTLNLLALAFTAGFIVFLLLTLFLLALLPVVLGALGVPGDTRWLLQAVRWPVLLVLLMVGLAALYRFGPCRSAARWQWVTWGSALATALWALGSVTFSVYVSWVESYNQTYGALASVAVMITWFYVSAWSVLLGAGLNAELEHQTARDTTTGAARPMGERGAHVADTLGRRRPE